MKVLIITSRDIFTHAGERSLMHGKDVALKKNGIETYYFCMRFRKISESTDDFLILGTDKTSNWLLKRKNILIKLELILQNIKPDIIVVSGCWLYLGSKKIYDLARKNNCAISLDMQGVLEEIKEYKMVKGNIFLSLLLYKILSFKEKQFVMNYVSLIEIVSSNGRMYLKQKYPKYEGLVEVVSCGVPIVYSDEIFQEKRNLWRQKLGVNPDKVSVVYAGSLSYWQRKDDIILLAKNNPSVDFYLFTPKKYHEGVYAFNYENIKVSFLPNNSLQEALCSFDYGILLRYDDTTNFFAFPNKASEYLNARLKIIVDSRSLGCICEPYIDQFISIDQFKDIQLDSKIEYNKLRDLEYTKLIKPLIKAYYKLTIH